MKTSAKANARAMMKEGASPSAAMMAAHHMKCAADGMIGGPLERLPADESPHTGMQPLDEMWHGGMAVGGISGKLSYQTRKHMKSSSFAAPGKRESGKGGYPIPDANHARNALSRVSQFGSPALKAKVRAAVHKKFPGIGK